MRPWLDHIVIDEFSELIPRARAEAAEADLCGALPARAFVARYRLGCLREVGHEGSHAPEARSASRLDAAARRRARHGS